LAAGTLLVSLLATAADAQQPSPDPASQPEQGWDYQQ
jgi:hypothetical protein